MKRKEILKGISVYPEGISNLIFEKNYTRAVKSSFGTNGIFGFTYIGIAGNFKFSVKFDQITNWMWVGVVLDSHLINSFGDKSWLLDVYCGYIQTRGSYKPVQSGGYRSASSSPNISIVNI